MLKEDGATAIFEASVYNVNCASRFGCASRGAAQRRRFISLKALTCVGKKFTGSVPLRAAVTSLREHVSAVCSSMN